MPLTVLPNIWMKRRRASSANRSSFVNAAMPLAVSSLRPRLRTVSIIPGIENLAPDRTLTRSGSLGSPNFLPALRSSTSRAGRTCSHSTFGTLPPLAQSAALKAARSPDLRDEDQNGLRREIITSVYGLGQGAGSFQGLANDIVWRRIRLSTDEVGELLYARTGGAWPILAPATRKVAEGATNVGHVYTGDQTNMVVLSLASGLCHSEKKMPEIIALRRPDGHLVILEGHARATAIVLEAHRFAKGADTCGGVRPSVANWPYL